MEQIDEVFVVMRYNDENGTADKIFRNAKDAIKYANSMDVAAKFAKANDTFSVITADLN